MSIELLQTMEWSKLCWDQSFEEIMSLDLILPKTGEIYSVRFEENEDFVREGSAFILWQPPHSELNGWDDKRPSEITKKSFDDNIKLKKQLAAQKTGPGNVSSTVINNISEAPRVEILNSGVQINV